MRKFMAIHLSSNNQPTFEHETKEEAIAEARRLADQSAPGTKFLILQQVGVVEKVTTTYTEFDDRDEEDEIPF